jgi:hypothetical protein
MVFCLVEEKLQIIYFPLVLNTPNQHEALSCIEVPTITIENIETYFRSLSRSSLFSEASLAVN